MQSAIVVMLKVIPRPPHGYCLPPLGRDSMTPARSFPVVWSASTRVLSLLNWSHRDRPGLCFFREAFFYMMWECLRALLNVVAGTLHTTMSEKRHSGVDCSSRSTRTRLAQYVDVSPVVVVPCRMFSRGEVSGDVFVTMASGDINVAPMLRSLLCQHREQFETAWGKAIEEVSE